MAKDVNLFEAAMAGVKPLASRRRAARSIPGKAPAYEAAASVATTRPAGTIMPELSAADGAFDRDIDRSLSRGKREPEATLDLHGMTLVAAERAATRFLEEAVALGLRVVLVVTGKGLRQEGGRVIGGRIRAEFVGWLNRPDNRGRVRGVRAAHRRHGGSGAFYVLLRRRQPRRVAARD
jgi:DNA-nicking Smr family endonuclease